MKARLLALVDRRTIVTLLVNAMLFVLAYRSEKIATASIDAITYITIALVGAAAAQKGLVAIASSRSRKAPKAQKAKEE